MPELPDVAVFGKYLESTSLHRRVGEVEIEDASLLKSVTGSELRNKLNGESLESVLRRGKYPGIRSSGEYTMLLHFGMFCSRP